MATSNAVRGASLLTNFWKAVEEDILAAGGTEEHLGALVTKKMRPAIREFAKLVVGAVLSFRGMIAAGKYDNLYGFADNPEAIEGQTPHSATGEVELDHPGVMLTTRQIWERFGDGDLSELLSYGIKNPKTQLEFPIGIVWKVGDQFWYAYLSGYGRGRRLSVHQDHPDTRHIDSCRFLRGKSSVAKAEAGK